MTFCIPMHLDLDLKALQAIFIVPGDCGVRSPVSSSCVFTDCHCVHVPVQFAELVYTAKCAFKRKKKKKDK